QRGDQLAVTHDLDFLRGLALQDPVQVHHVFVGRFAERQVVYAGVGLQGRATEAVLLVLQTQVRQDGGCDVDDGGQGVHVGAAGDLAAHGGQGGQCFIGGNKAGLVAVELRAGGATKFVQAVAGGQDDQPVF